MHIPHIPVQTSRLTSRLHIRLLVALLSLGLAVWTGWKIGTLAVDGQISDAVISARLLKLPTAAIEALQTTIQKYHHPANIPTQTSNPFAPQTTTTP